MALSIYLYNYQINIITVTRETFAAFLGVDTCGGSEVKQSETKSRAMSYQYVQPQEYPPPGYGTPYPPPEGEGYQGYSNDEPPPPEYEQQPEQEESGCLSFLKGCFAALCCCCALEECCSCL